MKPRPHILIGHFFAVALYAVFFAFKTTPLWAWPVAMGKAGGILYRACGVLLPLVWSELRTVARY